ncbi:DUF1648 domain-containing protein [Chryseomicrobium palamuruense]|uniref:DUF1648 domain-containing protein n=1 Tax=Chryseomicrobium palamuruense TaxID=682973 RepID=A0ABV8UW29_9BACL
MWKQNQPHVELEATFVERVFVFLSIGIYSVWVGWLALIWGDIPAEVPGHFGINGEVTRWGSKFEVLTLPIIAGALGAFMLWLRKHPEWHNFPVNITEENAPFYYRLSRMMLTMTSFVIVAAFASINWNIIQVANGVKSFLDAWFFPVFLVAVFAPILYFFYQMFRYQSKNKA